MAEKINPFREQPSVEQSRRNDPFREESLQQTKRQSRLDSKITISLSLRRFLKGSLLVFLFMTFFYMGRLTGGDSVSESSSFQLPDFSSWFKSESPSGLVTANATADTEETPVETAQPEVVTVEEPIEAPADEPVAAAANETGSTENQIEVVSYSKVSMTIDKVYFDWKETWGKIKGVKYTIKNNEIGYVKPDNFVMMVEGYEDMQKEFEAAYTSQKVGAGQTLTDESAVSGGFAYSPKQIPSGDVSKVRVTLFLRNANNIVIATSEKIVDLSGASS
ncbi:MAG: hypothetical protein AABX05_01130 [Nanoarchaeota archaeon]